MKYLYDPLTYRSPNRVWNPEKLEFEDLWIYEHVFILTLPDGRSITINPPFVYDKGSVPDWVQGIMPRDDRRGIIAFLIHDWLYNKQKIEGIKIERSVADNILYGLMRQAGMGYFKAKAAYFSVRAAGWLPWNKNAKTLKQ